jgi:hypothetical protein
MLQTFLSYKSSLLRSLRRQQLQYDLQGNALEFSTGIVCRGTFSREKFPLEKDLQGNFSWGTFTRKTFSGGNVSRRKFSKEKFYRGNFSRENVKGAHRFLALLMELAAQTATPVFHVVRTRCLTPCGVQTPAHSTCHFRLLHSNKGSTERCALTHTHTSLHCLHVKIVRGLKRRD